jgi:hypothetical protein
MPLGVYSTVPTEALVVTGIVNFHQLLLFYRREANRPLLSLSPASALLDDSIPALRLRTVKYLIAAQSPRVINVTVKTQFGCRTLKSARYSISVPSQTVPNIQILRFHSSPKHA